MDYNTYTVIKVKYPADLAEYRRISVLGSLLE